MVFSYCTHWSNKKDIFFSSSELTFIQIKNFAEPFVESIPQFFLLLVTKYACPAIDPHGIGANSNATNQTNVGGKDTKYKIIPKVITLYSRINVYTRLFPAKFVS